MNLIWHTILTHGLVISRNDHHLICTNTACRNQTQTLKHFLKECPNGVKAKYIYIYSDIKTILGKDCEMEKMRFFTEIEI